MLLAGGCAVALTACNENSWNDHLEGFIKDPGYTDVQSLDYTLTDADYNRLANNRFNVALAKEQGVLDELKLVGTQRYFNSRINPTEYIPNLLTDSLFKYFTLTEGSAINLTYNVAVGQPEEVLELNKATEYVVTDEDYQYAYGSSTDYAASFSPSTPASKKINDILKSQFPDAEAGEYKIVNYNTSVVDPVFNQTPEPPSGNFVLSNVLGNVSLGDEVDVNGIVTAKCTRGFILTDNTGSILVYNSGFDYDEFAIGDQVVCNAEISNYGNGLQIAYGSAEISIEGHQSYTYPTPLVLTESYLADAAANTEPVTAVYAQMTGKVVFSGNYINIDLGSTKVAGSAYYVPDEIKAKLTDGADVTLTGYFTSTSGKQEPYYCNMVITDVAPKSAGKTPRKVVVVPSVNENAVYQFDGSRWSVPADVTVLQPSDYTAMGQTYGNLSGEGPATYLPIYLKQQFPYAQADDVKYVMYKYYANSATTYVCEQFKFNGSEWIVNNGVAAETAQYVFGPDGWVMDPSIEVTLPAGKNQPLSTLYFQTCVDWIRDNVPDGSAYITSYGNNEYYCGTSAYQGNVDLRPSAARTQYSGYDSMTDDEIVALMKERFAYEVMPGALGVLYPNLDVTPGVETLFTIHFSVYTGTTSAYTIVYKVVGKAQFEYVSCDW